MKNIKIFPDIESHLQLEGTGAVIQIQLQPFLESDGTVVNGIPVAVHFHGNYGKLPIVTKIAFQGIQIGALVQSVIIFDFSDTASVEIVKDLFVADGKKDFIISEVVKAEHRFSRRLCHDQGVAGLPVEQFQMDELIRTGADSGIKAFSLEGRQKFGHVFFQRGLVTVAADDYKMSLIGKSKK